MATIFGDRWENPYGDPPEQDALGARFSVVERTYLEHPADPRSSVALMTCSDPMFGAFLIWDDIDGFAHKQQSNISDARWHMEGVRTRAHRASETKRLMALYDRELARVSSLSREEIIAEGLAHKRYGKFWQKLRAPLLLSDRDRARARINWKTFEFGIMEVREWLDDQGFDARPYELPLVCVRTSPGRYMTLIQKAIDFGSEPEAMFYKMRWL